MSKATPPFVGIIESTGDALILFEAARRGLLPRITRRLLAKEQAVLIKSGSIFIFDERESGIKRWTDSLIWSPSRIQSNFLLYRETTARADRHHPNLPNRSSKSPRTKRPSVSSLSSLSVSSSSLASPKDGDQEFRVDGEEDEDEDENEEGEEEAKATLPIRRRRKKGGGWSRPLVGASEQERERELVGSLTGTYRFKEGGLVKKSISIHINGVAQHLVSYYSVEDALSGVLRSPSSFPELASLTIHSAYLDPIHFRFPPKVRVDENGTIRFDESDLESPPPPHSTLSPRLSSLEPKLDRTPTRPSPASKRRSRSPARVTKTRKLRLSLGASSNSTNNQLDFAAMEHTFDPSSSSAFGQPVQSTDHHSRAPFFHVECAQPTHHSYPYEYRSPPLHCRHPLDASSTSRSPSSTSNSLQQDLLDSPGGIGLSLEGMELVVEDGRLDGKRKSEGEGSSSKSRFAVALPPPPPHVLVPEVYAYPYYAPQFSSEQIQSQLDFHSFTFQPLSQPHLGLYPSSNPLPSHQQLPPRPSLSHQSSEPIFTFPYAPSPSEAPHPYLPHQFQHYPPPPMPSRPPPHPLSSFSAHSYSYSFPSTTQQQAAEMYEVPRLHSKPQDQTDGGAGGWEGGVVQGGGQDGLVTFGWGSS